jgi:hypothetical protein
MRYYIGDPCYVLRGKVWDKVVEDHYRDDTENPHHQVGGYDCYLFNTAYGDGAYDLRDGDDVVAHLGVDAGMIGAVPLPAVNDPTGLSFGYVIDIDLSADNCTSEGGDMTFGHLTVNTSGE